MTKEEKLKKANAAIDEINKNIGAGSVITLSDKPLDLDVISTGSFNLDRALGVGGLPKGRIVEIFGPESSGKTTIAIHVIAEAQKAGGICAFVDAEHAFDGIYAANIGVNTGELKISQPDYGEQALEITDRLISSGGYDVVVVDSVAALVPKAELEGEMGESKMGLQARLMSQALRKLAGTVSKTGTILIFINQLREKIGIMFGNPETTTGGNALKYYASVRLDVRKVTTNKEGEDAVSNKVRVKVIKNKVAPPFKIAEFNIRFGEGIERMEEIAELAIEFGIIQKSGSWYSFAGDKIGQGFNSLKTFLKDNPEFVKDVALKVAEKISEN